VRNIFLKIFIVQAFDTQKKNPVPAKKMKKKFGQYQKS
jgi:hypothetical protein